MSQTISPPVVPTGPEPDAPPTPSESSADVAAEQAPAQVTAGGALAAGVSAAGAGIVLGSLFEGGLASVFGALGAIVGASLVAWSLRSRRAAALQWAAGPVALVLGALAALSASGAGGATIPRLVRDALFSGGLAQPPVPFDPGWRFLVVALTVLLGAGAASVALSTRRPNLGVAVAVPVVALGAVAQPPDAGPLAAIAGLAGVVGGLVVAYGVEVAREDESAGFQPRRILRGLAAMGALGVGLAVLASAASFLLPEPSDTQVIPPQRPPVSPPQPDVELFVVDSERSLPWRLGVLDVYEDEAWKTPPFDVSRFESVPSAAPGADLLEVSFTLRELAGRTLPALADVQAIDSDDEVLVDPRTGALRLDRLATSDVSYTVVAPPPATTAELVAATVDDEGFAEFLEVPEPPTEVAALLAGAQGQSVFERLQAVREIWYATVVAAGTGDPVDVPPSRVAEILRGDGGSEASPYEIVAGEALLARWVGVPSRMGYGWFGGDVVEEGRSIRPKHGSVWLEVHFDEVGWVPIVGRPPRAKGSLSDAPKNEDSGVRPTDELALITYVPIQRESITLLFEVVRFWFFRIVPLALVGVTLLVFSPIARRAWRRWRWSRWARRTSPAALLLTHYARLRDRAWDLNIGQPAQTPLEFADSLRHDDEHRELAWLVTRSLWGDLAEDLGEDEVDAVRLMSASVQRRMVNAQPGTARLIAAASRASLQTPYAPELLHATRRRRRRPGLRRRAAAAAAAVLLLGSCAEGVDLETRAGADVLPDPLVPMQVDDVRFQREPVAEVPFEEGGPRSLVDHGRVFTVRVDDTIEASLQVAALRPGAVDRFEDVRDGILQDLGGGRFFPVRVGNDSVLTAETTEQRLYLWFSPEGDHYNLLVARRSFERADAVFAAVLATQRGQEVTTLDDLGRVSRIDARRGIQ